MTVKKFECCKEIFLEFDEKFLETSHLDESPENLVTCVPISSWFSLVNNTENHIPSYVLENSPLNNNPTPIQELSSMRTNSFYKSKHPQMNAQNRLQYMHVELNNIFSTTKKKKLVCMMIESKQGNSFMQI